LGRQLAQSLFVSRHVANIIGCPRRVLNPTFASSPGNGQRPGRAF
jgi:hypothetical protein